MRTGIVLDRPVVELGTCIDLDDPNLMGLHPFNEYGRGITLALQRVAPCLSRVDVDDAEDVPPTTIVIHEHKVSLIRVRCSPDRKVWSLTCLLIQLVDLLTCKEGGDLGTREVIFTGASIELLE